MDRGKIIKASLADDAIQEALIETDRSHLGLKKYHLVPILLRWKRYLLKGWCHRANWYSWCLKKYRLAPLFTCHRAESFTPHVLLVYSFFYLPFQPDSQISARKHSQAASVRGPQLASGRKERGCIPLCRP